jgi:glycosyltransferase involved in cell wall biosynthesis
MPGVKSLVSKPYFGLAALTFARSIRIIQDSGLFDTGFYLAHSPDVQQSDLDPVLHFLLFGHAEGRDPNPLFDCSYYRSQMPASSRRQTNPLLHYITHGVQQGLDPHPLFDTAFYLKNTPGLLESGLNPLLHYLKAGPALNNPHPLFSATYYWENSLDRFAIAQPLLIHYLSVGAAQNRVCHPLFDSQYYCRTCPSARKSRYIPLVHYLREGAFLPADPHPLFDAPYYRRKYLSDEIRVNPLLHFLAKSPWVDLDPNPLFDSSFYLSHNPTLAASGVNPLIHYIESGAYAGLNPHADFDSLYYLELSPDIREHHVNPLAHFLENGAREGRKPNRIFDTSYYNECFPEVVPSGLNPLVHYLQHVTAGADTGFSILKPLARDGIVRFRNGITGAQLGEPGTAKIIFVTHEASRTGAPRILLRMVEAFAEQSNAECYVLTDKTGPLMEDFSPFAHVIDCSRLGTERSADLDRILAMIPEPQPALVIANTANTGWFASYFRARAIPVLTLIHEFITPYSKQYLDGLYGNSLRIIFPAHAVYRTALERHPELSEKAMVLGQGLLWDSCQDIKRDVARRHVVEELGLKDDPFLVLGCGSADQRKGIDLFLAVAADRAFDGLRRPVHFLWLGDGPADDGTALYWTRWDLKRLPHEAGRIHLLGSRSDPELFFRAADLFLMTSRADPFPCVIHEALGAELPVVAFGGSGGVDEMLSDGGGVLLPYRDTKAAVRTVLSFIRDEASRQEMGRHGRRVIEEKYDFNKYFVSIVKLIHELTPLRLEYASRPQLKYTGRPRPKIIFTNGDWGISGVNTVTETLVKGLRKKGLKASILFTESTNPAELRHMPPLPHSFLAAPDTSFRSRWQALIDYLEAEAPCILIPNYDYFASAVSPALSNQVGILGVVHSDDVEHYEHVYRLGRYWNRIVAVSEQTRKRTIELNGNFSRTTLVIRSGVEGVPGKCPQRQVSPNTPLRIIYTGRIVQHQKRVLEYLGVAEQLRSRNVPFVITMVGDGDQLPELRRKGRELVSKGFLNLPGRLRPAEIRKELQKHDVFLLLSDFEGLPVSLLEAMGHGCIPVATEIESGISEVVTNGANGLVVPLDNIPATCDALERLARDFTLRHTLSAKAHETIYAGGFRAEDMTGKYAAAIDEIWEELISRTYKRPAALTFRSKTGKILMHPSLHTYPNA